MSCRDRSRPRAQRAFGASVEASAAPDGGYGGVVELQNERAAQLGRGGQLERRLVWVRAASGVTTKPLLDRLERLSPHEARGADLLIGDFASLERAVVAALRTPKAAREPSLKKPILSGVRAAPPAHDLSLALANRGSVYVLCVDRDKKDCVPLVRFLRQQGLEPKLPAFSGEAAAVRRVHETLVAECDAVLLVYGQGDEAWKFHQQNELRKAAALRERPLAARFTCLLPPSTEDKEFMIETAEPDVIDLRAGFAAEQFEPFLAALPAARQAS